MTKVKRYNKTELENITGIPRNTITLYIKNFKEVIPTHQEKDMRYPLYEDEAIPMLDDIKKLYSEGKKRHEIREYLKENYNVINNHDVNLATQSHLHKGHNNDSTSDSPIAVVANSVVNESTARILKGLESVRYLNDTLLETSDQLAEDNKKLRIQNKALQQRIKQLTDELDTTKNALDEATRPTMLQQIFGTKKEG